MKWPSNRSDLELPRVSEQIVVFSVTPTKKRVHRILMFQTMVLVIQNILEQDRVCVTVYMLHVLL